MSDAHLQNAPNTREFPVQPKPLTRILFDFFQDAPAITYLFMMGIVISAVMLYMNIKDAFSRKASVNPLVAEQPFFSSMMGWTILIIVGIVLLALFFIFRHRNLGVKEQRQYYELAKIATPTVEQLKILRMDAPNSFYYGLWSQTTEYYPCATRLPNTTFQPKTFAIEPALTYRQALNHDWGIVSAEQYRHMVDRLFEGMHSKEFALDLDYVLHFDEYADPYMDEHTKSTREKENFNYLHHLAGLIEKPSNFVTETLQSTAQHPPRLVWGFDLWRVFPMARNAYMAGYISEQQAWQDMEKSANLIYSLFDTEEAYFNNLRLGHAYWSNNFEKTQNRREMWQIYQQHCNWPVRGMPWEQKSANWSEDMRTGFASYRAQAKQTKDSNPSIGFIK